MSQSVDLQWPEILVEIAVEARVVFAMVIDCRKKRSMEHLEELWCLFVETRLYKEYKLLFNEICFYNFVF